MKRIAVNLSLLVVLIIATACGSHGGKEIVPSARFLAAALKDQETKCGPSLELKYSVEFHKVGDKPIGSMKWSYVRTSDTIWARRELSESLGGETILCAYSRSSQEFRSLVTQGDLRSGLITVGLSHPLTLTECLETVLLPLPDGHLVDLMATGTVGTMKENVDGHDCWKISIPAKEKYVKEYMVWVDPAIGYNPYRLDIIWKAGKPLQFFFSDYTKIADGAWFPRKCLHRYFDKLTEMNLVQIVTSVTTGRAMPAGEIKVEFPSGTRVNMNGTKFTMP